MRKKKKIKTSARQRADQVKGYRCKNLIAVIEDSEDILNIGTIIRNVNALGVDRTYIIDPKKALPDDWQDMRNFKALSRTSVSAIKWSYAKRFDSTGACISHLEKKGFVSVATSPHRIGRENATIDETDFTLHPKLAVWFGNEKHGLSDEAVNSSILCVGIPMFGMIESLNLATTSGIVLYEVTRQRRDYQRRFRKRGRRVPIPIPIPDPDQT